MGRFEYSVKAHDDYVTRDPPDSYFEGVDRDEEENEEE